MRLFYFVFAVRLYNIWRLKDFLLKVGVDGEMDYAPVLTAGEWVERIAFGDESNSVDSADDSATVDASASGQTALNRFQ